MICSKCKIEKGEECYSWKQKDKAVRSTICKPCHSEYVRKHYEENADKYKSRVAASRPALKDKGRAYIVSYLESHPCVDCGEPDIAVLQFDHREPLKQSGKRVSYYKASYGKLVEEIAKCDVRCANCHMRKTQKDFGWERVS